MPDWDAYELERRQSDHAADFARRPLRNVPLPKFRTINVIGGNTLPSGQQGISFSSTMLTTFASAWDPVAGGAFETGVGYGNLYADGTYAGRVLIINDGRSTISYPLVMSWQGVVTGVVALPVSGSPTTILTAYVIGGV